MQSRNLPTQPTKLERKAEDSATRGLGARVAASQCSTMSSRLLTGVFTGAAGAITFLHLGACSLRDLSYLQTQGGNGGGGSSATSSASSSKDSSSTGSTSSSSSSSAIPDGGTDDGGNDAGVVNLNDGLFLHYSFDEISGTTVTDSSSNKLDGMVPAGGTWVSGKLGGGLDLSGQQQYVTLPAGILTSLHSITVALWVYWRGGAVWQRIFDFGSGSSQWMYVSPNSASSSMPGLRFAMLNGAPYEYGMGVNLASKAWSHVAVTLASPDSAIYINGESRATSVLMAIQPSDLGNTSQNWIGRSQYDTDPYLDGIVDDLRIYDRALSPAEISALAKLTR